MNKLGWNSQKGLKDSTTSWIHSQDHQQAFNSLSLFFANSDQKDREDQKDDYA